MRRTILLLLFNVCMNIRLSSVKVLDRICDQCGPSHSVFITNCEWCIILIKSVCVFK